MADYKYNSNKISPEMVKILETQGLYPQDIKLLSKEQLKQLPATKYGASYLQGIAQLPAMSDRIGGVTINNAKKDRRETAVLLSPSLDELDQQKTAGHELEHVLMKQGLPRGKDINSKWSDLVHQNGYNENAARHNVVERLIEHAPYFVKNYGLPKYAADTGYFSKDALSSTSNPGDLLQEQLATLSALEQNSKKMLTRDPYVIKNIFTDQDQRETYNALTGLRQSKLDAKDLAPYTRHTDPQDLTTVQEIKKTLGLKYDYKKGGKVNSICKPVQGGKKTI